MSEWVVDGNFAAESYAAVKSVSYGVPRLDGVKETVREDLGIEESQVLRPLQEGADSGMIEVSYLR